MPRGLPRWWASRSARPHDRPPLTPTAHASPTLTRVNHPGSRRWTGWLALN